MRTLVTGLALVALMALAGCNKESEPGGPGATGTSGNGESTAGDNAAHGDNTTDENNTFKVQVPSGATNIQQGTEKTLKLQVEREDKFNQVVTLSFQMPAGVQGITVTPETAKVEASQKDVELTIAVAPEAPTGKHTIKVTGTPETGTPTTADLIIEVKKPDNSAGGTDTTPPAAE